MNYLLLFHCNLHPNDELVTGKLILVDKDKNKLVDEYLAASGCPGYQEPNNISSKGRGPIPPPIKVDIDNYWVTSKPLSMPGIKGVEGNFYQIFPGEVEISGVTRGDFGIHADKNVPGSSGCVVLTTDVGWQAFQKQMCAIALAGVDKLPLQISYSNQR